MTMSGGGRSGTSNFEYHVEVRRPLHRPNPSDRLERRWRARSNERREDRASRPEKKGWNGWDWIDLPLDDMGVFGLAVMVIAVAIAAVLLALLAGPFVWILVGFAIDLMLWLLLAIIGLVSWLVLGRPWQVVVIDQQGVSHAKVDVRGRRAAHARAVVVRDRLAAGLDPLAATTGP